MSKNFIAAGGRVIIRVAAVAHSAGDLVFERGYFGIVQDDVAVGDDFVLILGGVWSLPRLLGGANFPMGDVIYAAPTISSTGLILMGAASLVASAAPVGRAWATSNASQVKVLIGNRQYDM